MPKNQATRPFPGPEPGLPLDSVLANHGAKVLDPTNAVVLAGQRLRHTAYAVDRLLVPASANNLEEIVQLLRDAADGLGLDLRVAADGLGLDLEVEEVHARTIAIRIRFTPKPNSAVVVDAWPVLQRARANPANREVLAGVGLDHILLAHQAPASTVAGSPFEEPHSPTYQGVGGQETWSWYAGPYPVNMVMPQPRRDHSLCHRPVVAVVDTGCGQHSWFTEGVYRSALDPGSPDPENGGGLTQPMDGARPRAAGHGTFIAGLIRQRSPNTDILAIRLLGADGLTSESDLLEILDRIGNQAEHFAESGGRRGERIDVVSLSCGYYHEETGDHVHPLLQEAVRRLGRLGIVVVASAGNDATERPMFPAAFAPHADGPVTDTEADAVPLVSVGALNPDGSVALFSNSARWVLHWEAGASVVSTMPETFDFGINAAASTPDPVRGRRGSVDPDRFTGLDGSGGWGVWSGTSFAAPVLAGRLAEYLVQKLAANSGTCTSECVTSVNLGWSAVEACCPTLKRPETSS